MVDPQPNFLGIKMVDVFEAFAEKPHAMRPCVSYVG